MIEGWRNTTYRHREWNADYRGFGGLRGSGLHMGPDLYGAVKAPNRIRQDRPAPCRIAIGMSDGVRRLMA